MVLRTWTGRVGLSRTRIGISSCSGAKWRAEGGVFVVVVVKLL
jgi:hypothetical protein